MTDAAARRQSLIASTLAPFDSHVDVHFVMNGIPHIVRRRAKSGEAELRIEDQDFVPITQEDVRALLPVEAYSQRQLSSVAVRLDEVMRFVTNPIRRRLDAHRGREIELASQLRANYANLQRYRGLHRSIKRDTVELNSLTQQAANLRQQLTALSPEDQAVLSAKPGFDRANDAAVIWLRRIEQLSDEVKRFKSAVDGLQEIANSDAGPLQALRNSILATLSDLSLAAAKVGADLESKLAPDADFRRAQVAWQSLQKNFEAAYSAAKARSASHKAQLDALADLEKRRTLTAESLAKQNDELKLLGDPPVGHDSLRSQWIVHQKQRSALIQEQCDALAKLSDGLIRAKLEPLSEVAAISDRFRGAVVGSGVRRTQIELFVEQIKDSTDPLASWLDALDALEKYVLAADDPSLRPQAPNGALAVFGRNDVDRIVSRLSGEQILELSLVPLGDRPVFEYRTKVGEYMPFESASPGQQATALLRVLLSQPGLPLIIDQPEDDLDSQVVLEIAERIWAAKRQRQLVFVSHNANLVVNGDAELVVACDYRAAGDQSGAKIKLEGAIDVPQLRQEIATVMEGGERAFRMRQEKYGF